MNYSGILAGYLGVSTFLIVRYLTPSLNLFIQILFAILIGLLIVAIQCKAEKQAIEEYKAREATNAKR